MLKFKETKVLKNNNITLKTKNGTLFVLRPELSHQI
mgnify:CR=1 FL=1